MTKKDLRIVFMGTPEFAVGTLEALTSGGYNVVAVVTQPDKPAGRHQEKPRPSAVKIFAEANGIPVLQPEKMKDPSFLAELARYEADVQVVVAFRMLPEVVWDMPRYGTFNLHAALLPQYRGAAPINWAIINGERMTGVTTFFIDHEIDTGRVILQEPFEIKDEFNVEDVYDGLMRLGAQTVVKTLDMMIEGNGHVDSMPQEQMIKTGDVLHDAPKIFNETCRTDWNKPAADVHNFVRGLSPYPGAWSRWCSPDGQSTVIKIFKTAKTGLSCAGREPGTITVSGGQMLAATATEWLQLDEIQLSGKKRMQAQAFLNGCRNAAECRLE